MKKLLLFLLLATLAFLCLYPLEVQSENLPLYFGSKLLKTIEEYKHTPWSLERARGETKGQISNLILNNYLKQGYSVSLQASYPERETVPETYFLTITPNGN